jgi:hypothetical protein
VGRRCRAHDVAKQGALAKVIERTKHAKDLGVVRSFADDLRLVIGNQVEPVALIALTHDRRTSAESLLAQVAG